MVLLRTSGAASLQEPPIITQVKSNKTNLHIMKKVIIALLWCTLVFSPCLLMFCQGGYSILSAAGIDDGPYLVQLLGISYSWFLYRYHRFLIPRWIRNVVDTLVRDE